MFEVPPWYVNGKDPFYQSGKFLNPGVGNNAFSFSKKSDRSPLAITPLQVGNLDDLKLGTQVVFQDFDGDQWLECVGLESAILCLDYSIPIYIFDNHNHVFYAWCEALKMGWFQRGATLVHMDEHFDAAFPLDPGSVDVDDLEDVWRYTNEVLQIATYIKPALKLGIFSECVDYVESRHFETRKDLSREVIMNLDIDVFHPDMSHISWREKIDVMKYYLPQTKLITIATSPYFIDQQKAIDLVHQVIDQLFPA